MAIVKLETGEELEFDNNYSDEQISQAVEEYLGQKQPQSIQQSQQAVQPRQGEGFFEENIARPALRAGKSIVASGAGLADVANMAAELPLYAGNRAFEYGRQALGGQQAQPYQPTFMQNNVAEATRQGFDEMTGGLTANRNKGEQLLEIPQEIAGSFISPAAAVRGAQGVAQGAKELVKGGLQKFSGVKPELVQSFEQAGVTPRLADVSTSKPAKAFQNLLEVFPGSASTIKKATDKQIVDIENQLAGLTKSRGGTIQETGKKIQEGATQFKGLVEDRVKNLYDALDEFIPSKDTKLSTGNFRSMINDEAVADSLTNNKQTSSVLQNYQRRLNSFGDEQGNLPYKNIKSLRSNIGRKMQTALLDGDETSSLKKLYGALSEDMKSVVVANGGEKGLQSFNKANSAFARSQEFLEANINPLIEAQTPEKVYDLALRGAKQGGSRVKPIMTILNPTQKDFVRGTIVKRMGAQNAGLQDETGEVFSPNKFLTEWNKLSPEARKNIFTPDQVKSIDTLNKAISNIKETSKLANKSNNAPWFAWSGLLGVGAFSPLGVPKALLTAGGARISAEMFTNPNFIKWLANPPKSPKDYSKHIEKLSAIAAANSAIREDVLDYLKSITMSEAQAQEFDPQQLEQDLSLQGFTPELAREQAVETKQRFYR
jgi:hypothetical protein